MSDDSNWFGKLSRALSREPHNQSELIEMLRDAHQHQLIDRDALQMIEAVIAVSDKKARDIMIPRSKMVVIGADATPDAVLPLMIESQHSRFPVIEESPDKVVGIILAKDLLQFITQTTPAKHIRDLIRPAFFVPESKKLDVLLKEFRLNRNHMAIVIDEYGNVSGLVTIEDVLEEIVGEIEDEYDIEEEQSIKPINENLYLVNALTSIPHFNAFFKTNLNENEVDTIGGFIIQKLGYFPKRNEKMILDDLEVTVIKASKRGIQLLQVKRFS